ncbi:MAG: TIGR02281 family clan AA aspartic protease [Sphingorhabdus sp.]
MEDGPSLIWGIVMLMLLISSLAARRLAGGQMAKMALAWIAIFAALFVIFSFRFEFLSIWERVKADFNGTSAQSVVGETVEVKRQDDGHYWVQVQINGKATQFMIDTGATTTAVNSETAQQTGIIVDRSGFPVIISTANGKITAQRGTAQSLQLGPLKLADHHVVVSGSFGETNVLGMNFLDSLKSWKVENNVMTLQP